MHKLLLSFFLLTLLVGCNETPRHTLSSPNGDLQVVVWLGDQGQPRYAINYKGESVLRPSQLGLAMDYADFTEGLRLVNASDVQRIAQDYQMLTGKQRHIQYRANQQNFTLANAEDQTLEILFRVSDDGVAFRYGLLGSSNDVKKFQHETTSFALHPGAVAWLQPMAVARTGWSNTNPSYEEHYRMQIPVGTPSPSEAGWVFPALFKSGNAWLLISETGLNGDFHGSRLRAQAPNGEYSIGTPMAPEVYTGGPLLAQSHLPFHSPWRIIAVGSLATIVESTLGTDLAPPAIDMDRSFIEPGQASWSWALLKDDSITYDIQKRFIDYAADMQWEYTLIDANWDTTIGYEQVEELADYAASKGVGLLLWYNSSGDWNTTPQTPKNALLTQDARAQEFSRLQEMGIRGIKVDFFAGDGQSMMQYYIDILEDAAKHKLLVNFHGSTLPRGLQRTYPNLMTMEAVRGLEFVTFSQDSADRAASHSAMLPFARNAFDPMDYTPTTFSSIPNIQRQTSNGFELAQTVLFLSGIQHIAETPAGMAEVPGYVRRYMRELPESWDETRFIQGYPGELAVIARRAGERWYVAGINGEDAPKNLDLDLSFLAGRGGELITDGDEQFSFRRATVSASPKTNIHIKRNGGFVLIF